MFNVGDILESNDGRHLRIRVICNDLKINGAKGPYRPSDLRYVVLIDLGTEVPHMASENELAGHQKVMSGVTAETYLDVDRGDMVIASEWHPPVTPPSEGETFRDDYGVMVSNTEKGMLAFFHDPDGSCVYVQPGDYIIRGKRRIVKPGFFHKSYVKPDC